MAEIGRKLHGTFDGSQEGAFSQLSEITVPK